MSTVAFTAWYDHVLPDVPGCPVALALIAIREAAIEFCQTSRAWRYNMEAIPVQANIQDCDLDVPNGAELVEIIHANFDGKQIDPKGKEELRELFVDWRSDIGTPEFYTQDAPYVVLLVPIPDADVSNGFAAELAIAPKATATSVDASIFNRFRDAIKHGALARLMANPKKPYTDLELSAYHKTQFDSAVASAADKAGRGFTRAKRRTKSQFF